MDSQRKQALQKRSQCSDQGRAGRRVASWWHRGGDSVADGDNVASVVNKQ